MNPSPIPIQWEPREEPSLLRKWSPFLYGFLGGSILPLMLFGSICSEAWSSAEAKHQERYRANVIAIEAEISEILREISKYGPEEEQ